MARLTQRQRIFVDVCSVASSTLRRRVEPATAIAGTRVVKGRLRGEARLVRYTDDFVICFQYRSDALRVQDALRLRLGPITR
jgi:hypothetical protein